MLLDPTEDYENPFRVMTFLSPTMEVKGNQFKFFENGVYKRTTNLNEIRTIGETVPEDAEDALNLLLAEIELINTTV